ncbi:protein LURP-one-related 4-like [Lycium barbarum]|uniref:protein LURP-one-related 4-like n=1 Tax=Lycium barbarum TaxID=112863 RepID=UPI00293E671D|nr:protein LURP-one-related 4-like [Lycium barbarum]
MGKIHPENISSPPTSPSSCSSPYVASIRETFTIWMKSLVFHGNGCTVFNSKGELAFRVDNYQEKCSNEIFLMDFNGQVLFSIKKEKLRVFGRWNGYLCGGFKGRPWFQVRKNCTFSRGNVICNVNLGHEKSIESCYKIQKLDRKSSFKVTNNTGEIVAELKQKQSSRGFAYGDDVLTLEVEPEVDQSLIMALVTVCGLITRKL